MAHSSSLQMSKGQSRFDPYEHFNVAPKEDGTLIRFAQMPTTPATGDEGEELHLLAVVSKDVVLDAEKKTSLRIYRPTNLSTSDNSAARLPIIFSFHTGGFILFDINNTIIHESCNHFCSEIPAIIISVGYRLAPESRLPAQYEDATDAINWAKDQAVNEDGDPWIRDYGDFSRCFLYGTCGGGNIAFNAALRVLDMELKPISIVGIILNQPLFGGKKRTRSEIKLATDPIFPLPGIDLLWELALPEGKDRDHRFCNPFSDSPTKQKTKHLRRILVIGFGGDPLIDRQQALVRMLVFQGVEVEARFDDVGFHDIDLIDSRRAAAIVGFVKEFVNRSVFSGSFAQPN